MSLVVNVSLKIHHVIFNNEPSKFILTPYYLIRVVLQQEQVHQKHRIQQFEKNTKINRHYKENPRFVRVES